MATGLATEVTMIKELVEERGHKYGRAWYLESQFISMITEYHTNDVELPMLYSDYSGPWGDIVKKLMRLAWSPEHVDSWADIEGYARLARRHIEDGVWHGEEPNEKVAFTAECNKTYKSTVKAWDSREGEIEIPVTHYEPHIAGQRLQMPDNLRVASLGDETVIGVATEDVKAGELVVIATKGEHERVISSAETEYPLVGAA
jgi:hypothetical protein